MTPERDLGQVGLKDIQEVSKGQPSRQVWVRDRMGTDFEDGRMVPQTGERATYLELPRRG